MTGEIRTEVRPDHDGIPAETAVAVRRAVAHYAAGQPGTEQARGQIYAQLLDILGLGGEAMCDRCGKSMSRPDATGNYRPSGAGGGLCWKCAPKVARRGATQPICACGRKVRKGVEVCHMCRESVPMEDVRAVVERIEHRTRESRTIIARNAGIHESTLTNVLAPRRRQKRLATETYRALVRYAAEVGA